MSLLSRVESASVGSNGVSVAKVLPLLLLIAGCASSGIETQITTPPTVDTTAFPSPDLPNPELDLGRWTGELEWAIVEECAAHGIVDCGQLVDDMKQGACSVEGARSLLAAIADNSGQQELADLHESGDCADLSL